MCGITGFLDLNRNLNADELTAVVNRMSDSIRHRGPDDSGAWVDAECGIALGFRRLAILDLSPTGHQPMSSADGRYEVVFNGEIYNFAELRGELTTAGFAFRGTSDTEVMLAGFCHWGVEGCVNRLNGMFAIALWDRLECTLHLVRDRLGIKPLYYGWQGNVLMFGSELKTLRSHPAFQGMVDRNALALYLRHFYVPAPYSIYNGVQKLEPGSMLRVRTDAKPGESQPRTYWSARDVADNGMCHPFGGSFEEAVDQLDALLRESVRLRMIADVPLGAFLSGGVDSSTIVALMQAQSQRPVKTFTIGFDVPGYNEAVYAKEVARHLHTEHSELYVTPEEARAVIPMLPAMYDEPFSDASQIPTYLVSRMARQHVTVSLSGDGGDELFAGYNRYFWWKKIRRYSGWLPAGIRSGLARRVMETLSRPGSLLESGLNCMPARMRIPQPADKLLKLAEVVAARNPREMYLQLVSQWKNPAELVRGAVEPQTLLLNPEGWGGFADFTQAMMYLDLVTYLPDDILAKVDRASMATSLEARVPYLDDHRVVEFAWKIPMQYKIRDGQGKWLLRQVLYRYVPRELIERPKMGFSIPIDTWLRGELRDWAEDMLSENRLAQEGYFNPTPIRQKWAEHLSGRRNWQYQLWDILMFQAWLAEQGKPA